MEQIDQATAAEMQRPFGFVRCDAARYFALSNRPASLLGKLRILFDSPGLQAVLVYRFGSWVGRTIPYRIVRIPLRLIWYIMHKLCIICWGIYIDEGARIGPGLYIGHFGGVIIGPIQMGRDCNVAHQVTIGMRADGVPGVPVIGNRVWIGVGSIIFGSVRIGDGVTIGPLTVVSRNLPARVMVMGNPLRMLRREYDNFETIYGRPRA